MELPTTLSIKPSPRILRVLGDIEFEPWQCIAELIDNLQGDPQMLLKRRLRPAPSGAACATRVDGEERELEQACIG